jgi:hypothetical protein
MQGKKLRSQLAKVRARQIDCQALKSADAAIAATIRSLHCLSQEEYSAFVGIVLDDIDAGRVVPYAF